MNPGRVVRPAGGFREGQLVFAFHPHQDRFVADAGDAVAVDDLDPRAATLYPTVETALQVTLDAAPRLGETVVVVGLGAVGILAAALLARTGAVVLGKWSVVALCSAAVVILTLLGFKTAMQFIRSENLSALMQFGGGELALFVVMLLPF